MSKSLQLLASGYYFRFTIPAGLRQRVGARELRIPLGTLSRAEAELRSSILRPFTSHLLLQLRESGRSMDIREIRAHAVTHCNLQLDGLASSLKLHVHRNRGDSAALHPQAITKSLLNRLTPVFNGVPLGEAAEPELEVQRAIKTFDYSAVQQEAQVLAATLGIDPDSPNFLSLCDELLRNYLHVIAQAKALADGARIDFLKGEAAPSAPSFPHANAQPQAHGALIHASPAVAAATNQPLSKWVDIFLGEIAGDMPKDREDGDFRAALEVLVVAAADVPAHLLTSKVVKSAGSLVLRLPAHRTKKAHLKTLTVAELLALQLPPQECISGTTLDKYTRYINRFLRWLHEDHRLIPNLKVEKPRGKKQTKTESYADFSPAQLAALLSRNNLIGELHVAQFWAPLIAAYSGMRVGEIAFLRLQDIMTHPETGILYFNTQNMGDEDEDGNIRDLKTENSYRIVPVHTVLLDVGLMDYMAALVTKQNPNPLVLGMDQPQLSKWFNREEAGRGVNGYRARCGVSSTGDSGGRLVFHSFRHSAITSARHGKELDSTLKKVFGHESTRIS